MTTKRIDWINRGKSINQLIKELRTFEDQDIQVLISVDGGKTSRPISLVVRDSGTCMLLYAIGSEAELN